MKPSYPYSLSAVALTAVAILALPSTAGADVYVVRPRPVIVAPPPPLPPGAVYLAPTPAGPVCTTRTVRVWVNGAYTYRAVQTCY
jgi:hypothetical protein